MDRLTTHEVGAKFADEGERTAELWARTLDARQQAADLRDVDASERDRLADEREAKADLRDRELLTESAVARLQARLETLPVIEQAKGMIMERKGCTADEAFELLRKASQRSNVPVRELATRVVARNTRRRRPRGRHEPAG